MVRSNLSWQLMRRYSPCNLNPTTMADASMSPPEAPADTPPPAPPVPAPPSGSPNEFLKAVVGKRVVVRLLSGVDYKGELHIERPLRLALNPVLGVLQCLDGYMNIAMEQTEEHVNGVIINRYGDALFGEIMVGVCGHFGLFHLILTMLFARKSCTSPRQSRFEGTLLLHYIIFQCLQIFLACGSWSYFPRTWMRSVRNTIALVNLCWKAQAVI